MLEREIEAVLYAPRERRDALQRANQRLREARADATANGAIRYDKDKVQTSPDDPMSKVVAEIMELEKEFKILKNGGTLVSLKGLPNGEFAERMGLSAVKKSAILMVSGRKEPAYEYHISGTRLFSSE